MSVALIFAAQMVGYLPPPPPRRPITDPMFAASPIRELRRQWDDCVYSMQQIALMNGITDEGRAAGMVGLCIEYEDQLTGALAKRFGMSKANTAMSKARKAAETEMRSFARRLDAYVKAQPPPPPKVTPKPAYDVEPHDAGCGSEYLTGSGDTERALGFFYDRAHDNQLSTRGMISFAFREPTLARTLSEKPRRLRYDLLFKKLNGNTTTRLSGVQGRAWLYKDQVIIATDLSDRLNEEMMSAALDTVTISGSWGTAHEFEATKFSQMVGDVQNCARKEGAWSPGL